MTNKRKPASLVHPFFHSDCITGSTYTVVWSSDGTKLAWITSDLEGGTRPTNSRLHLWDSTEKKTLTIKIERDVRATFSIDGKSVWTAGTDAKARAWDVSSGRLLETLDTGNSLPLMAIAWAPNGKFLALSSGRGHLTIWNEERTLIYSTEISRRVNADGITENDVCLGVAWKANSKELVSAGFNATIINITTGKEKRFKSRSGLYQVIWGPGFSSKWLAAGAANGTVIVWDISTGEEYRVLEGHNGSVKSIAFSPNGEILASHGIDGSTIFWRCSDWSRIGATKSSSRSDIRYSLAFNPVTSWLASIVPERKGAKESRLQLAQLRNEIILSKQKSATITYKSAKIVLVGESGAGKTGLGWRLANGFFKDHASTHGQQFWLLNEIGRTDSDGAQCEAVLWDLAGQPDYRLIHALFLDDVDLALVVFDPTKNEDPLYGVEFWLKQLQARNPEINGGTPPPIILVAARADRGTTRLSNDELKQFCINKKLSGYVPTSALTGNGIPELLQRMTNEIHWEKKPATVTTDTFKQIKDYVLRLKESETKKSIIFSIDELRKNLKFPDRTTEFSRQELTTVAGHLANHGYVALLKTSKGEPRILLIPELLNNLAASIILEARRNPRELGSLEEKPLLNAEYDFPELKQLLAEERVTLLDSTVAMLLKNNICYRETDPFNGRSYLVFPELINMKKPTSEDEVPMQDGAAYTVSGAIENTYASMVVLLGYTDRFTRTNQWRDQARYEVGNRLVCGFRLEEEREGELDFVLYFGENVSKAIRTLFTSLFEYFLTGRKLEVHRYDPVLCSKGHQFNRAVIRDHVSSGINHAYCSKCGGKVELPRSDKAILLTNDQAEIVEIEGQAARQRSLLEQAIFRLTSYVRQKRIQAPDCFISYAWGDPHHERWVERLAADLLNSGVSVILDRWENGHIGSSVHALSKKSLRVKELSLWELCNTELNTTMRPYEELRGCC